MGSDRSQRLVAILVAARGLPSDQVEEFLRSECQGDESMHQELRRKLDEAQPTATLPQQPERSGAPGGAPAFAEGRIVAGRYRILRFVNRGGMGEVYEARDLELRENIALKTLLRDIADDVGSVARFKQEIQLARKVAHPNVCRVYDLARDPGDDEPSQAVVFLTMEFLAGETLDARLRREGPMPPAEALPLVEQMAAALDAAHEVGVIHRDFKPSNVMLTPAPEGPRAVVTDFGLALHAAPGERSAMTRTLTGFAMGTAGYMAPELMLGGPATRESDVYAFGVSVHRMLAGAPPPPAGVAIPNLDPVWEEALRRALDPDPAKRFSRAGEFVETVRGVPAAGGAARPISRRAFMAVCAAAAAVAGGWQGFHLWRGWRNNPPAEAVQFYHAGAQDLRAGAFFAATKSLGRAVQLAPRFSLAHARLAEAWMELEVQEKALMEILVVHREGNQGLSALDRLQLDAIELSITREHPAAARKYEQMLAIAGAAGGDIHLDLGRTWERAAQQPKALHHYRLAVQGSPGNPAAWLRLAALHSQESKWADAAEGFRKAEELYQASSNLEGLTEVAYQRSADAIRRQQLPEGAAQAAKALDTARATGNPHQQIRAMVQLGSNAYLSGDAGLAERYAREAFETARAYHIESLAIRGLLVLGNAHRRKGDRGGAERLYLEAAGLARQGDSRRLIAMSLLHLAALHREMSRSDEAFLEAKEALEFFQPNRFARESCQCLTIIGRTQQDRGEGAALDSFRQCLKIAETAQDAYQMALAHESLGSLLAGQERFPEALAHQRKEREMATDELHAGFGAYHCAATLWTLGRYGEAEVMFEAADAVAPKQASLHMGIAVSRAEMALSRRRFTQAAAMSRAALAAGAEGANRARFTGILGAAQAGGGDRRAGLRNCEEALTSARRLQDQSLLTAAELRAAEARLAAGDAAGAIDLFRQVEPRLANLPHSRWTALVLAARADRSQAGARLAAAKQQLDEIERDWGRPVFEVYLARPDLQELARALPRATTPGRK